MKTLNINSQEKRSYFSPSIECIKLDNEISLQLESPGTPDSPDEVYNTSDYFKIEPYKTNLG